MFVPRLLRGKEAYQYVGLSRQTFNILVKPYVTEIKTSYRILLYDRLELDAWVEHYKASNGRPPEKKGVLICQEKVTGLSWSKDHARPTGTFMEHPMERRYEEALKQATERLQKSPLPKRFTG